MENRRSLLSSDNLQNKVIQELTSRKILDEVYEELLKRVKTSSPYKEIKSISVNQYLNPAVQYDSQDTEAISKKKFVTAKIGLLTAFTIDNVLHQQVRDKIKNLIRPAVKKITETFLKSSTTQHTGTEENSRPDENSHCLNQSLLKSILSDVNKINQDKNIFQSLHRLTSGSATSLEQITQHIDDIAVKHEIVSDEDETDPDKNLRNFCFADHDNANAENLNASICKNAEEIESLYDEDSDENFELTIDSDCSSSDSISSVHTSELSSFDDEISLSSEGEECTGRRMSLKDAMELCLSHKKSQNLNNENSHSLEECGQNRIDTTHCSSGDIETPKKELPPRKRKQNPKYVSEDIISYTSPLLKVEESIKQKKSNFPPERKRSKVA